MKLNKETGFTLIEILLAITLLAIVIIPMLSFFGNSVKMTNYVDTREKALYLAQQTIETLKAAEFEDVNSYNSTVSETGYQDFYKQVVVTSPEENLKDITVTISWNQVDGKWQKSLLLQTRIAKR